MRDEGVGQIGGDRVSPAAQKAASEREAQILELRCRKIPFEKIGQTVGMTKSAVCKAYYRALHRIPNRYAKDIVTEDLEILERMENRLWREIERPGQDTKVMFAAIDRLLRVQQRRAKLLGLDAPQQLDVNVLRPLSDETELTPKLGKQMLDRLTVEDKRLLLELLSKMSGVRSAT